MKIWFPNCGSGAGISICAAINALLNWHNAERTLTAARKKNVQITPGWDYRPRESVRRHAAADAARAKTAETLSSSSSATDANNVVWFDCIHPDPIVGDVRAKTLSSAREHTVSTYD
jgi:hypothetical protein